MTTEDIEAVIERTMREWGRRVRTEVNGVHVDGCAVAVAYDDDSGFRVIVVDDRGVLYDASVHDTCVDLRPPPERPVPMPERPTSILNDGR